LQAVVERAAHYDFSVTKWGIETYDTQANAFKELEQMARQALDESE
jgi:hypothetical protein